MAFSELETKIREQLTQRAQKRRNELQQAASRCQRTHELESKSRSETREGILAELKTITSRRGFLCQQLQLETLTPLKRWHVQLQQVEMANGNTSCASFLDVSLNSVNDDGDDIPLSTLEQSLAVVGEDRSCFDIEYATAIRISDLKDTLFDASEQQSRICEALAFSTTRDGLTIRVVLFTLENHGEIYARSSLYVAHFEGEAQKIYRDAGDANALVDCLWTHFKR